MTLSASQKKWAHILTILVHFVLAILIMHFTNKDKKEKVLLVNYIFIGMTILSLYPILNSTYKCDTIL